MAEMIVLLTGASRGIGRAVAERFLGDGALVAATARSREPLAELERLFPGRARGWQMDVTKRAEVDRVVAEAAAAFGRFDVVINNAGAGLRSPLDQLTDQEWELMVGTNLSGPMFVTRAALPHLADGGSVVNLASVLGKVGAPHSVSYCTTKHGVVGMTRALALDLAGRGIRVNAVCPGWVATEGAQSGIEELAEKVGVPSSLLLKKLANAIPQKRFLEPAEIADLIAFLVSPAARGITGQALSICGGQTPY